MDATASTPRYSFDAQLMHATASSISGLWRDTPATGTINATAHLELAGYSNQDLARSAQGTFHWEWTQGGLPYGPVALARFDHWNASGNIQDTALRLTQSQVTRGMAREDVSGTISFDRKLNLTINEDETEAHVAVVPSPHAR
jgi:hypothetical protein